MRSWWLALTTLLASLRRRGPVKTARLAWDEWRFDRRHGLDTGGLAPAAAGGHPAAEPYMPTAPATFAEILGQLDPPVRRGAFLDLGCGKGRVMALAAQAGLQPVIGVELDPALARAARRNLARLPGAAGAAARVIVQDAARYPIPAEVSMFYLFNPFSGAVLDRVLENIRASLEGAPRPHVLIYMNPVCHDRFLQAGFRLDRRGESAVGQAYHLYGLGG